MDEELDREYRRLFPDDQKVRPEFYKVAAIRAKETGTTAEEILRLDLEHARNCPYPLADCLEPHEIDQLISGETLTPDRMQHKSECHFCNAIVETAMPTKNPKD